MKYKLINNQTKEETLCDKVTIDGFDYYVKKEIVEVGDYAHYHNGCSYISKVVGKIISDRDIILEKMPHGRENGTLDYREMNLVITTNNPNIDIPKVVDEVDQYTMAQEYAIKTKSPNREAHRQGFIAGYNKSQETHPFSEEDVIEFAKWINKNKFLQHADKLWSSSLIEYSGCLYTTKELLQLWKEQKPKIVYYE